MILPLAPEKLQITGCPKQSPGGTGGGWSRLCPTQALLQPSIKAPLLWEGSRGFSDILQDFPLPRTGGNGVLPTSFRKLCKLDFQRVAMSV